jgi:hypothetical protein
MMRQITSPGKGEISETTRYLLVSVFCVLCSLAGIVIACWTNCPTYGTRGGTVALGATLIFLIAKKDLASKIYLMLQEYEAEGTATTGQLPTTAIDGLKRRFQYLSDWIKDSSEDQQAQNWYLFGSTFVGTIVSAFGDAISSWLMTILATHR